MMPSSSANVEAPPTAGMQLMEGELAGEVPAGVHPGALSSNARAGAGDTNAASAGGTNGPAIALCELLAVKLGIGGGPARNPRTQPRDQGRHKGGDRRSESLFHLLLDNLRNPPHLCLEFLNLSRLAFRAGLFLLPHTSGIV